MPKYSSSLFSRKEPGSYSSKLFPSNNRGLALFLVLMAWLLSPSLFGQSQFKTSELESSEINVAVLLKWEDLEEELNRQLKDEIYDAPQFINSGGSKLSLNIRKLSRIELQGTKEGFISKSPLLVRVKGVYSTRVLGLKVSQNIDQLLKMEVYLKIRLQISPKWTVQSKSKLLKYEWLETPYLDFGIIKIPLNRTIDEVIKKNEASILENVDQQIQQNLDFKAQIEEAWKSFQEPLPTSEWGEDKTWLWFKPQGLFLSTFYYSGEHLRLQIQVPSESYAELAPKVQKVKTQALPRPQYSQDDFEELSRIVVYGKSSKETALEKAKEIFRKEEYSFRNGKYRLKIQDLDISSQGKEIQLTMDTKGSIEGRMYLSGIPVYNHEQDKLEIKNFQYDTREAKVKISGFIRWLFKKKIKRQIKAAFEEAINEQVRDLKESIRKSMAYYRFNSQALMESTLEKFYFDHIEIDEEEVRVRAYLDTFIKVNIKPF